MRHQQFGEGIIVESKISSGEEEVIVVFDTVGVKRLIASLAKLDMLRVTGSGGPARGRSKEV